MRRSLHEFSYGRVWNDEHHSFTSIGEKPLDYWDDASYQLQGERPKRVRDKRHEGCQLFTQNGELSLWDCSYFVLNIFCVKVVQLQTKIKDGETPD